MATEPVHPALGNVLDDREPARHVAVERRVADGHLALVAGRENEPAELVTQGHQYVAPRPALQILLRHARFGSLERIGQHLQVSLMCGLDRNRLQAHAEPPRDLDGVGLRMLGREA